MKPSRLAEPLPVPAAAEALNVSERQLRRMMAEGCPVARRGRKGRGNAALLDVSAVAAWQRQGSGEDVLRVLADELPEVLAEAAYMTFRLLEESDKKRLAGLIAGQWTISTNMLLDHMREKCLGIPELQTTPEKISQLRQIFTTWRTVSSSSTRPEETPWKSAPDI